MKPWVMVGLAVIIVTALCLWRQRNSSVTLDQEINWQLERDSLVSLAKMNMDSALMWKQRALARNPRVVTLDTIVIRAKTANDSLVALVEQNYLLRVQVDEWQNAFRRLEQARQNEFDRATAAEMLTRSYQRALGTALNKADCRLFGIGFMPRCPSRTVSLVLGAGVASAIILTR